MSDPKDLIDRLSRSLEPADRERFRQAAEAALVDLPPAMVGPGTVYRAIELAWRAFFRPVDPQKAGWSHDALAGGAALKPDERSLAGSLKAGFGVTGDGETPAKSLISMVGAQGLEPWTR